MEGIIIKKYEIVKKHQDFDTIIKDGIKIFNKYYIIYYKESNYSYPKFGIAVGKKVGNAVVRNKIKRQIRMIITTNKNIFKNYQDYIIIVKRNVLDLNFSEMKDNLVHLIEK